jgi:hypothetical protein
MPWVSMKQSFLCLAVLSLLFAACKKNESTPPPPVAVIKYLQSTVDAKGDSIAIEFNIDKSIYKAMRFSKGEDSFFVVIPDYLPGGLLATMAATANPNYTETYLYRTLTYNDVSKPLLISFYNADISISHIDSIAYNSEGLLAAVNYYEYNTGTKQKTLLKKYAYTWDAKGKNIIKQDVYIPTASEPVLTTNYTFDDKINPALKVIGYYIVNFDEEQVAGLLSANNVLTSATSSSTDAYTASDNNTYSYDEDDYPVVMTLRSKSQYPGEELRSDSVVLRAHYGK